MGDAGVCGIIIEVSVWSPAITLFMLIVSIILCLIYFTAHAYAAVKKAAGEDRPSPGIDPTNKDGAGLGAP